MTIYVDSMFIPATVGRIKNHWCHLVSDTYDSAELHPFAQSIGLKRAWFQWHTKMSPNPAPPWLWHYDVTENKRTQAIAAGALVLEGFTLGPIMDRKREIFDQLSEVDKAAERARWEAIALGTEKWEQAGLF
jgi:hypothetical protein